MSFKYSASRILQLLIMLKIAFALLFIFHTIVSFAQPKTADSVVLPNTIGKTVSLLDSFVKYPLKSFRIEITYNGCFANMNGTKTIDYLRKDSVFQTTKQVWKGFLRGKRNYRFKNKMSAKRLDRILQKINKNPFYI